MVILSCHVLSQLYAIIRNLTSGTISISAQLPFQADGTISTSAQLSFPADVDWYHGDCGAGLKRVTSHMEVIVWSHCWGELSHPINHQWTIILEGTLLAVSMVFAFPLPQV